MSFKNRAEAGKKLAKALEKYKNRKDTVIYALPRGGVITAIEIARYLHAPLDLIITRKIGHPYQPEYAIAATAENGHIIGAKTELETIDGKWLKEEIERERQEAKRRKEKYLQGKKEIPAKGKIAILVDDGVATGLTMRVGILELKHRQPEKIIVAVPVAPKSTADLIKSEADEFVALDTPSNYEFLGSVGAYYDEFLPVEDEEVIKIMKSYEKEYVKTLQTPITTIDPVLFTFPYYNYMIKNLELIPNLTVGKFELKRYPNKELHIKLQSHAKERECIVLGTISPPEINVYSFLLLCHTLKKENAHKIIAVLPYLAYSRHDKKEPQKSYATALVGEFFKASGASEVITIDVHSPHVKDLFPITLISLSPAKVFAEEITRLSMQNATIVAPDEGAIKRAKGVAEKAGITKKIAYIIKKRTEEGIEHFKLHGKVGEKAIIVDDMLDTGKTLISCCEKLKEKGVKEIIIMVTHGLFTGDEWKKLWELGVKQIYCTDTIPLSKHVISKDIKILSVIPLLVEKLKEEYQGIFTIDASKRYDFYDYGEP